MAGGKADLYKSRAAESGYEMSDREAFALGTLGAIGEAMIFTKMGKLGDVIGWGGKRSQRLVDDLVNQSLAAAKNGEMKEITALAVQAMKPTTSRIVDSLLKNANRAWNMSSFSASAATAVAFDELFANLYTDKDVATPQDYVNAVRDTYALSFMMGLGHVLAVDRASKMTVNAIKTAVNATPEQHQTLRQAAVRQYGESVILPMETKISETLNIIKKEGDRLGFGNMNSDTNLEPAKQMIVRMVLKTAVEQNQDPNKVMDGLLTVIGKTKEGMDVTEFNELLAGKTDTLRQRFMEYMGQNVTMSPIYGGYIDGLADKAEVTMRKFNGITPEEQTRRVESRKTALKTLSSLITARDTARITVEAIKPQKAGETMAPEVLEQRKTAETALETAETDVKHAMSMFSKQTMADLYASGDIRFDKKIGRFEPILKIEKEQTPRQAAAVGIKYMRVVADNARIMAQEKRRADFERIWDARFPPPEGEAVTVRRPDGSIYKAILGEKWVDDIPIMGGKNIAHKLLPDGTWTSGVLDEGDVIVSPPTPTTKAEVGRKPITTTEVGAGTPSSGLTYSQLREGMNKRGYSFLFPHGETGTKTEGILTFGGYNYPTFVSKDGNVKIALGQNDLYIFNDKPWRGDPSQPLKNAFVIEGIYTSPEVRGQGRATQALKEVLSLADELNVSVKVEPTPIKSLAGKTGRTREQLITDYKKLGFEQENQGSDQILIRTPSSAIKPAQSAKVGGKTTALYIPEDNLMAFFEDATPLSIIHEFTHHMVANNFLSADQNLRLGALYLRSDKLRADMKTGIPRDMRDPRVQEALASDLERFITTGKLPQGADVEAVKLFKELKDAYGNLLAAAREDLSIYGEPGNITAERVGKLYDAMIGVNADELSKTQGRAVADAITVADYADQKRQDGNDNKRHEVFKAKFTQVKKATKMTESEIRGILENSDETGKKSHFPEMSADQQDAAIRKLNELIADREDREIAPDVSDSAKTMVVDMKIDDDGCPLPIYQQLIPEITGRKGKGKEKRPDDEIYREEQDKKLAEIDDPARREIVDHLSLMPSEVLDARHDWRDFYIKPFRAVRAAIQRSFITPETLANVFDRGDPDGPFHKYVINPMIKGRNMYAEVNRQMQEFIKKQTMKFDDTGRITYNPFWSANETVETMPGKRRTRSEALGIYVWSGRGDLTKDENGRYNNWIVRRLTNTGQVTAEEIATVKNTVETPGHPKYGSQEMQDIRHLADRIQYMTDKVFPLLQKTYYQLTGRKLGKIAKNYLPVWAESYLEHFGQDVLPEFIKLMGEPGSSEYDHFESFLKSRTRGLDFRISLDADNAFLSYMTMVSRYVVKDPILFRIEKLMGRMVDPENPDRGNMGSLLTSRFGKAATGQLESFIRRERTVSGRINPWMPGEKPLAYIRNMSIPAFMGGRITTTLLGPMSGLPTMSFMDRQTLLKAPLVYAKNLTQVMTRIGQGDSNPWETTDVWKDLPAIIKNQWYESLTMETGKEFRGISEIFKGKKLGRKISEVALYPFQVSSFLDVASSYQLCLEQGMKLFQGDVGKARDWAIDRVLETHSATTVTEKAPIQTANEFMRSLVPFFGQPIKDFNFNLNRLFLPALYAGIKTQGGLRAKAGAVMESFKGGNDISRTHAMQKLTFSMVLPALAFGMIARRRAPTKDEVWQDILSYPLFAVPFLSNALNPTRFNYDNFYGAFWYRIGQNLFEAAKHISKEGGEKGAIKGIGDLGRTMFQLYGQPVIIVDAAEKALNDVRGYGPEYKNTMGRVLNYLSVPTRPVPEKK
jgi:GNAT superfamily N-acetyltransferase